MSLPNSQLDLIWEGLSSSQTVGYLLRNPWPVKPEKWIFQKNGFASKMDLPENGFDKHPI